MAIIYKANAVAEEKGWDWDTIFANDATETVDEFETIEEALQAYEERGYDSDLYGVF